MGSGGSSKSKTKAKDLTPKQFRALRPEFGEELSSTLFGTGTSGGVFSGLQGEAPSLTQGTLDPNAFARGISSQEQALVDQIFGNAFGSPETAAADQFRTDTISGRFLEPDEATRAAFFRPIEQAFEQGRREDLGTFTQAGHIASTSSPFARERRLGQRDFANALADAEVQLRQPALERQFAASQEANAQDAQRASTAVQRLQAVALPRLVEDLGVERGLQVYQQRVAQLMQLFNTGAQLLSATPINTGSSSSLNVGILS